MISEWMDLAFQAACRAGHHIMELYADDLEIQHKEDHSPVTIADRQAHTIIQSCLSPSGIPMLSEEGRDIPYGQRRLWRHFWLIDPLDGTKEFLKRNDEFTVNIALMENDRPIAGVVYAPALDRLYFGQMQLGSYKWSDVQKGRAQTQETLRLKDIIGEAQKLPAPNNPRPFTIAGSRSHATPALEAYLNRMRAEKSGLDFISAGSSLKFCLVAEGLADQYPRLGPTMEWDTAAGQAVAEAAGATVLQWENRVPLRYNKESLLNPWFVVDGPGRS
jgi:3'(2'), 5'-bisphosphate nucleotidase